MKDLGLVSNFLGLNITQNIDVDVTIISKKNYLTQVLERYGMSDCNGSSTPINKNFDFNTLKREKSKSHEIETKCRQLTGSLMYATIGTKPDLCSTVMFLSRFQSGTNQQLYKALKQVLRYVKETIDLCLIYKKTNRKDIMVGYVDADWGGDVIDRKLTTGYCYLLFGNVISWCCEKQQSISLSSTEAEYVALDVATSEACWLKSIVSEFSQIDSENYVITLFEDNQSSIKVAYNPEHHKRMKHLDIKYHFIREKVN